MAVVFDCDGVLASNGSSWQSIHESFGTENKEMFTRFVNREIDDDEFMADDVSKWMGKRGRIHKDDIARCYSGVRLMSGAQEVVEKLQKRGVLVAIVSSGVDILSNGRLDVEKWMIGLPMGSSGMRTGGWLAPFPRGSSHSKGIAVEKFRRINDLMPEEIISVGDSGSDISMRIEGSRFIGFNLVASWSLDAFKSASVPIVESNDLRSIWPLLFEGEGF